MKLKKVQNQNGTAWLLDYYEPGTEPGTLRRVKRRFAKKKDAEDEMALIQLSKKKGRYAEIFKPESAPAVLFAALSTDYLGLIEGQRNASHKRQVVNHILLPRFGECSLTDITYRDLELFRKEREKVDTYRHGPRSVARVNRELAVLRHMFNKALAWGWIDQNPFMRGETLFPKEKNARIRFLTQEEWARLRVECVAHLLPIVETALNTGMRKGEVLALRWEWVRDAWVHLPGHLVKSGEGRAVPLNEAQLEVFKEVRSTMPVGCPHVFPGLVEGRPMAVVRKGFEGACRRAGIVNFRFHDLRHTCASWMVMAGASLKAVQEQLGHKTLAMTMRYAHLAPGHQQEAINLIGTRDVVKAGSTQKANSTF
jgi:integrase